jgi:hypothetical protein
MKSDCNGAEVGLLIEEELDQVNRIKEVASAVRVIGASSKTNRIVDVKQLAFN